MSAGVFAFLTGVGCAVAAVLLLSTELGKNGYHVLAIVAGLLVVFAGGVGATFTESPGSGPQHEVRTGFDAFVAALGSPHFWVGYLGVGVGVAVGLGLQALIVSRRG